jgi:uncharacterized protein with HEPN domain
MPRDLLQYVIDLEGSCEEIQAFTVNMLRSDYEADLKTQRAVERDFTIIGEAIARIREHFPHAIQHLPEANKIVAFRNVLVHQYSSVDNDDVWSAIQVKVPELLVQAQTLRASLLSGASGVTSTAP